MGSHVDDSELGTAGASFGKTFPSECSRAVLCSTRRRRHPSIVVDVVLFLLREWVCVV